MYGNENSVKKALSKKPAQISKQAAFGLLYLRFFL